MYYTIVIFTQFLYISVPGIILSIKPKTSTYITRLTAPNTCVLHHGYIYRISVYFSSRYNSECQTSNYSIFDPVNVSKYLCITPWLYIQNFCMFQFQVYNSEYQYKNYCICDPVNVSKYMCITPWLYIQNVCIFQF